VPLLIVAVVLPLRSPLGLLFHSASGNPARHVYDVCIAVGATAASSLCGILAAGESGNELLGVQDMAEIQCMELGFPVWACDGYKAWTA